MALIKCPKCGEQIPDNSKFCQECGCDVLNTLQEIEREQKVAEVNVTIQENNQADNEDVPMPRLSSAFGCGIAAIFFLILFILNIANSFIISIITLFFVLIFGVLCIGVIQDYRLAKSDFEKYRIKALKEQKETSERQAAEKAKKEQEQKIAAEKVAALRKKRAEYAAKGIVSCPKCGSISIATGQRGYSMVSGFIGSGKTVNRCANCGYVWKPHN